jgi:hypothetical protein
LELFATGTVKLRAGRQDIGVLHIPQDGFGVRATSYLLRVGFSLHRAKRSEGECNHTFPFIDDVNV